MLSFTWWMQTPHYLWPRGVSGRWTWIQPSSAAWRHINDAIKLRPRCVMTRVVRGSGLPYRWYRFLETPTQLCRCIEKWSVVFYEIINRFSWEKTKRVANIYLIVWVSLSDGKRCQHINYIYKILYMTVIDLVKLAERYTRHYVRFSK